MEGTAVWKANIFRAHVMPYLLAFSVGAAAIAVAFIGAALTGDDNVTGGVNGFIEGLSGRSSGFLGDIGVLAPLGFAFAAGMVSTVNPCGFAMLPAYLGLYLGSSDTAAEQAGPATRVAKGLLIGMAVTAGFILIFTIVGLGIGFGARSIIKVMPWIGFSMGILLAMVGSWLMAGGKVYSGLAVRAGSRIGNPAEVGVKGYFMFGLSYAICSLSCTLPILLAVVGISLAATEVGRSVGQLIMYSLGMGLVIVVLTLSMAIFKEASVRSIRKTLRYVQPLSAVLMVLAGSYIVFYWLTIGGLF